MKSTWPEYYASAKLVVFVVDCANRPALASACVDFLDVISAPELKATPIMLVLNKA